MTAPDWAALNINANGLSEQFSQGEPTRGELVNTQSVLPYGPLPITNEIRVIEAASWPGDVGCVYPAHLHNSAGSVFKQLGVRL